METPRDALPPRPEPLQLQDPIDYVLDAARLDREMALRAQRRRFSLWGGLVAAALVGGAVVAVLATQAVAVEAVRACLTTTTAPAGR